MRNLKENWRYCVRDQVATVSLTADLESWLEWDLEVVESREREATADRDGRRLGGDPLLLSLSQSQSQSLSILQQLTMMMMTKTKEREEARSGPTKLRQAAKTIVDESIFEQTLCFVQ